MKKRILPIFLFLIIICNFYVYSKAEFNINVGDEFRYEVLKWNWEAISGSNSSSFQGFRIDDLLFSEGDEFLIKVLNMDDNFTADYRIEKDGFTADHHTSAFGVYINMLLIIGAPTIWFVPNLPFNETRIQEGPNLDDTFYPFFDKEVFELFDRRANSTYISSRMSATYRNNTDIQITYETKKGHLLYEQYLNYGIKYTAENYTFDGIYESNLLYSIDEITGVLHGFRMACREHGLLNGTNFDLKSEGHLELKDYNMPKFDLGSYAGLPGFTFLIVPVTLAVVIVSKFIFNKKQIKQ